MTKGKTPLELAEQAKATLALYQEAVAQKEEALFHAVDEEIRSHVAIIHRHHGAAEQAQAAA